VVPTLLSAKMLATKYNKNATEYVVMMSTLLNASQTAPCLSTTARRAAFKLYMQELFANIHIYLK